MWVSKDFIVLMPPRCASTSLAAILASIDPGGRMLNAQSREEWCAHRHVFPGESGVDFSGRVVFCASRDPLDWAYSCYENFWEYRRPTFPTVTFSEFVFDAHGHVVPDQFDWFVHYPDKMAREAEALGAEVVRYRYDDFAFLFGELERRFGVPKPDKFPKLNSQSGAAVRKEALDSLRLSFGGEAQARSAVESEIYRRPAPRDRWISAEVD